MRFGTNTISTWVAAVGVTAVLSLGAATPSLANSNDGGILNPVAAASSRDTGASDEAPVLIQVAAARKHRPVRHSGAYRARAQVFAPRRAYRYGGYRSVPRFRDDPPGAAFQSRGIYEDLYGCPC